MTEYEKIFAKTFKVGDTIHIVEGNTGVITKINNGTLYGTWGNNSLRINYDHFYKIS